MVHNRLTEKNVRSSLAKKLRGYGWHALEEVWVKNIAEYRADIIAYHQKYAELGWFLFEVKKRGSTVNELIKAHKQIVFRYLGASIHDYRYPELNGIMPLCYVFHSPVSSKTNWNPNDFSLILHFFNRYGIGILPSDRDFIFFEPSAVNWSRVYIDPPKSKWLNILRLKEYLDAQVFGV